MITIAAIITLAVLAGTSLALAPELAADVARIRRLVRRLIPRRAGVVPPGPVAASAWRTPGEAWNPSPATGGAPGWAGPGAVPPLPVPAGRHAAGVMRLTERTVPRKPTRDRPPWDIDTTSFPALTLPEHTCFALRDGTAPAAPDEQAPSGPVPGAVPLPAVTGAAGGCTGAAGGCTGTTGGQLAVTA